MIQGILLAAGSSTRFGADKLLRPLADGTPMALACAQSLATAADRALAVVRPDLKRALADLLEQAGLQALFCATAHHGMGHSLACGVQASAGADGWIIALADMPYVRPQTVARIARSLRAGSSIAAPVYRGRRGHPVGFSRDHAPALLALRGDRGARALLARHPEQVAKVDCDDPGILRDVDRPDDLAPFP